MRNSTPYLGHYPSRQKAQGMVMIFALVLLLSLTLVGVAALSGGISQQQMTQSNEQSQQLFNAAESALAGVVFEAEDETLLNDEAQLDALSQARQLNPINLSAEQLHCFVDSAFVVRRVSSSGLTYGEQQTASGEVDTLGRMQSWSRTAFVEERACRGSSNVIGSTNLTCHVFIARGCGQLAQGNYAVANTMVLSVLAPASGG